MTERPILFSGEMVRAILEGRKTQTRRVVKSQPSEHWCPEVGMYAPTLIDRQGDECPGAEVYGASDENEGRISPYGQPGDRLWARESFQPLFAEGVTFRDANWETGAGYAIRYVATDGRTEWVDPDDNITDRCKPGIHMPRWASRINLEITKVRVERVQEISEADAKAEGVQAHPDVTLNIAPNGYRTSFRHLWTVINAARGFGWDVNPWTWVIEFKNL